MANMKRCSTLLVIREQIKITTSHNSTRTRLTIYRKITQNNQKCKITSVRKDVEKLEPLHIISKNAKWCSLYGKH